MLTGAAKVQYMITAMLTRSVFKSISTLEEWRGGQQDPSLVRRYWCNTRFYAADPCIQLVVRPAFTKISFARCALS